MYKHTGGRQNFFKESGGDSQKFFLQTVEPFKGSFPNRPMLVILYTKK
jgi:hypothetical protein